MEESAAKGAAVKGMLTPSPSIALLKARQGVVEFCLRVAVLGIAFLAFISACVARGETQFSTIILDGSDLSRAILAGRAGVISSSGWIIFVTLFTFVVEGLLLALRFLNFPFTTTYRTIFYIVDIVISSVFAAAYLCGAIALAVYADDWADIRNLLDSFDSNIPTINPGAIASSSGATSAFSFFSVFAFVGLAVWMVLTLLFKWGQGGEQHAVKSSTVGAD